jgi:hypothetical protein
VGKKRAVLHYIFKKLKNEKGLIMLFMVTMVCVYETYLLGNKPMIGSQWRI